MKTVCQGFLVLFRSTSDTIVAGMLLSLAYLKAIQWLAPFKDPALNRIKEISVWQIFFVFMIALLIKMDDIDSDFLAVCLLLVFFVNFLILLGQYLVKCCSVRVPRSGVSRKAGDEKNHFEEVEMRAVVSPADTLSSSLVNDTGTVEEESGSEDGTAGITTTTTTAGGIITGHERVAADSVTVSPLAVAAAAGSQSQSQSSSASDMMLHTDTAVEHTHSPLH
jgi:hypothetical protein